MLQLNASIEDVSQEYVLMQAWKKASAYIRYHNWFADTLELDAVTASLPSFVESIAQDVRSGRWTNTPLRMVPAPKSQRWGIDPETGRWVPSGGNQGVKLRPLAHVSLRDQVAATAVMLCLADRVETRQRDPRMAVDERSKDPVVSYGNRLFCDQTADGHLRHRWGSSKLFRAFYQDYRSFLARPEIVAESLAENHSGVLVLQSDLKQFYDRVKPELLRDKINALKRPGDDDAFFQFASQLLCWEWHRNDIKDVRDYARISEIEDFSRVSLPQGLVAAGFFANVVLLDFDAGLNAHRNCKIGEGIILHDATRYVDDLRLVLTVDPDADPQAIETKTSAWLAKLLDETATGLVPSPDKTTAAFFRGDTRPLLRQSRKMARIQTAVSGGFDAAGGEDIIEAVQGLVRTQERYSERREARGSDTFLPVPDVRDETVGRFAAARFRTTYRSLRPLLQDSSVTSLAPEPAPPEDTFRGAGLTKSELDDEARTFALGLIDSWVANPSNVRLLRIGLDLWPAADILNEVLALLRPYTVGAGRGRARRVALYCLSEILRAGATETGFVENGEAFPTGVDIAEYRQVLGKEAARLLEMPSPSLPWYLKQQAMLFLAVTDPELAPISSRPGRNPETKHYRDLICFLRGNFVGKTAAQFATLAIITRRSILGADAAEQLLRDLVDQRRISAIAKHDPSFAGELLRSHDRALAYLSLGPEKETGEWISLHAHVLGADQPRLRNDIGVLSFAYAFIKAAEKDILPATVTPWDIELRCGDVNGFTFVDEVRPKTNKAADENLTRMYQPPSWSEVSERWKFQVGYLIRYILTGNQDFTEVVKPASWRERQGIYRPTRSHWYQRIYGFYNGHEAFGDDWLPISHSTENLLFSLLAWPGCKDGGGAWLRASFEQIKQKLAAMLQEAAGSIGEATGTLMLKVPAPLFNVPRTGRPLRACVVQTVTPEPHEFDATDLTFSASVIRRKHRNHLSTALAAVVKMLELRETHKSQDMRLDWLILPELAVHPEDIKTHLVPFARAYKTIILAGLTYECLIPGDPFVNSAMWIIPRMTPGRGLQMVMRRQGKQHLAPLELPFEASGLVHGFRPCQWLVGYEWTPNEQEAPLWLTAAVCYDATDLKLASDLRSRSDVFAIPALNQDVGTFDQMALALHYHMYQLVVVANNGRFGGSNAHIPRKESYLRQVFHTHGQPQASISFFEIDDIQEVKQRHALGKAPTRGGRWKYPPAGA